MEDLTSLLYKVTLSKELQMIGTKYHKIQSIFKRDPKTKAFTEEFTCPEFELLQNVPWDWSEKVDGTNIRITWRGSSAIDGWGVVVPGKPVREIGGRTDRAQIPADLFAKLEELFPIEKLLEHFDEPQTVILFGEGIGPKIQKGGGRYRSSPDFALFDVRVGRWWLKREDVFGVAETMGLAAAPCRGEGTLQEAIEFVKAGFTSELAEDPTLPAEGLVLRPKCELFSRSGERMITKVKTKDFRK
jgi:hypothetical protein